MIFVIVEDEILIREGISALLQKLDPNYEIAGEADNGQEGLELILRVNPDVVITDIKMPVMDGLEMLSRLHNAGRKIKAIVLSAYSEFEYARQAMKLGVTEYLLKPIILREFSQSLDNVKKQIEKEEVLQPEQMGSLEQIFQGILTNGIELDKEIITYLNKKFQVKDQITMAIICVYMGNDYEKNVASAKRKMDLIFKERKELNYCVLELAYAKSLLILAYNFEDAHRLERWLQYQTLNGKEKTYVVSIGWTVVENIYEFCNGFKALYQYMDWNIALGDDVIISYPKITNIQTAPCTYPIELENQMKVAICASDRKKINQYVEKFYVYFRSGKVYAPKEIKECYVRFLWSYIDIAKEIGCLDYHKLEQQKLLEKIMDAKTFEELHLVVDRLISQSWETIEDGKEGSHLTVKRAKSMIKEFYQTGITLDEIATKLNITPEYLGTQFHKELEVNFSTYIKNFRINKAKVLLLGTQLKLYEIAEQVGYTDPKYFSRVFKECTGQLPADYRKTHN